MLPTSIAVIVATAALTLVAALVMLWAWRRGFFRDLDAQSRIILDPRDDAMVRPWETPVQRAARRNAYGAQPPAPGEWGGAA